MNDRTAKEILLDMDPTAWERFPVVVDGLRGLAYLFNSATEGNFEEVPSSFGRDVMALLHVLVERLERAIDEQSAMWTELMQALRESEQTA